MTTDDARPYVALPALRPVGRHKAYYDELKAISAQVGPALIAEVAAIRADRKLCLGDCLHLALRYRLKLAALFAILEDANQIPTGTYDRLKDSNIRGYADGTMGPFAPRRLLTEYVAGAGLPEPAPGYDEETP